MNHTHNNYYHNRRFSLSACVTTFTANGIFAQIAQILMLRELLIVLEGDELALGMMLASWLIWVGIGACLALPIVKFIRYIQAKLFRGCEAFNIHLIVYTSVIAVCVVTLPFVIICIRLVRNIFSTPLGTPLPFIDTVILSTIAPAITCMGIGMLFPLSVYITNVRPGKAFGLEGVGALIGGMLFTFVWVTHWTAITISGFTGVVCAAACFYLLLKIKKDVRHMLVVSTGIITLCGVIFFVFVGDGIDNYANRLKWDNLLPNYSLVNIVESPYGRYALLEHFAQYSLFLDGHLVEDIPDALSGTLLTHTVLLQHQNPQDILILGYGLAGTIREVSRHKPEHIDYVDLDKYHYDILKNNIPAELFAGLNISASTVHISDPLKYLKSTDTLYDVILVDMPDPFTLGINRYYVKEFYELIARHLKPESGVTGITISGGDNYLSQPLISRNSTIYKTVRSVFPNLIVSPGSSCLIIAGNQKSEVSTLTLESELLAARYNNRQLNCPEYLAVLYTDIFQTQQTALVNASLSSWPDLINNDTELAIAADAEGFLNKLTLSPQYSSTNPELLNTNLNPAGYWQTRIYNTHKFDADMFTFVESLPGVTYLFINSIAFISILTVVGSLIRGFVIYGRPVENRTDTTGVLSGISAIKLLLIISIAGFGFACMAFQVLILLWYQSQLGQVYVGLALLSAIFMSGLSVGTMLGDTMYRYRKYFLIIPVVMIMCTVLLYYFVSGLAINYQFIQVYAWLFSGVAGLLLGTNFDMCSRIWWGFADVTHKIEGNGKVINNSAGWLYTADMLGASIAAFATAAIIVPVYGYFTGIMLIWVFTIIAGLGMLTVNILHNKIGY